MNRYDEGLKYSIFVEEEYKDILFYLDKLDIIFDIGAYRGYFTEFILNKGFKGKIVLVEPVNSFIEEAKNRLKGYSNLIFENKLISENKDSKFYLNLTKPGQSGKYFVDYIQFNKELKFFKTKQFKQIDVDIISFSYLLKKYGRGNIGVKMDIEGEEINVLSNMEYMKSIKFFIVEYHLFNEDFVKKFDLIQQKLKQYFYFKIISSKYSKKVGLMKGYNIYI